MRKALAAAMAALLGASQTAAASCDTAQDAVAIHAAALQQEMMVAAFMCRDVDAYNAFVLSHQSALQESDRALMAYFERTSPGSAFDAYNFFKTELANASSLRSVTDPWFCTRVDADYRAATGSPLEQLLSQVPYPVQTGSVYCPWATPAPVANGTPPKKRVRHRTWLGRLVDSLR